MQEKVVGILGGMGPEATVDLMQRIIKATPASDDVDHIRVLVDNNPKVPSRIKALLEKDGTDPLPCLQEMARKLQAWGVDFLAMPCNTAHYYHAQIQSSVHIPLLNMLQIAVTAVINNEPNIKKVGILASTAVLNLGIYSDLFAQNDISVIVPDKNFQQSMMHCIYNIKTGSKKDKTKNKLQEITDNLINKGAQAVLIACTEISIFSDFIRFPCSCYDSSQILAETIVKEAKSGCQILQAYNL